MLDWLYGQLIQEWRYVTLTSTHPSTHSLTHWVTHSLNYPFINSLTHGHSFRHSPTHPPTHPLTHSLTHSRCTTCKLLTLVMKQLINTVQFNTWCEHCSNQLCVVRSTVYVTNCVAMGSEFFKMGKLCVPSVYYQCWEYIPVPSKCSTTSAPICLLHAVLLVALLHMWQKYVIEEVKLVMYECVQ